MGADSVVLVIGRVADGNVAGSYAMVGDGLGAILEDAANLGVTLAIEPMMASKRSVITRSGDATTSLRNWTPSPRLGAMVDAYRVWWDWHLEIDLVRLAGRIAGLQLSGWVTPLTRPLISGRGMIGDGCMDR
jgi:sugar phosphate isomerase/epimerase